MFKNLFPLDSFVLGMQRCNFFTIRVKCYFHFFLSPLNFQITTRCQLQGIKYRHIFRLTQIIFTIFHYSNINHYLLTAFTSSQFRNVNLTCSYNMYL